MKILLSLLVLFLSASTSLQGESKRGSVHVAIRARGIRAEFPRRDQSLDESGARLGSSIARCEPAWKRF